jgi:hypothetical protein
MRQFGQFDLFQFIVPLTFLAIWALTALFNREAQPLPPRTGRPSRPNGPGPRPAPASSPAQTPGPRPEPARRPELFLRDSEVRRPAPPPPDRAALLRPAGNDEILIIESDLRRPPVGPAPRVGATAPRRSARTRAAAKPATKLPEPAPVRPLSGTFSLPITSAIRQPEGIKAHPLSQTLVLPPAPQGPTGAAVDPRGRPADVTTVTANDLGKLLSRASDLRQSYLLGEVVFRPPLALRNGSVLGRRPR